MSLSVNSSLVVYVTHIKRQPRTTGNDSEEPLQKRLVAYSGISYIHEEWYILISLYNRMCLRTTFFLPIYCIASSTPKYLREKAYGGAVHDK